MKIIISLAVCFLTVQGHIHSASDKQKSSESFMSRVGADTWFYALSSSLIVGMCGIFPLFLDSWVFRMSNETSNMKFILSFAVGGLLGDVFLHLLPESWGNATGQTAMTSGVWVLVGVLIFLMVEKLAACSVTGQSSCGGYLNLAANCTDNFTHGLALAASYSSSHTVGILTTAAIVCHEVPHEVGDFAILMQSGFSKWSAAKAQLFTSFGGVFGVVAGFVAEGASEDVQWILSFTAGGFLYISLVSILPNLFNTSSLRVFAVQVILLLSGILVMALVTIVEQASCSFVP